MPRTYLLHPGAFCTKPDSEPEPERYEASWPVSDEQAALIHAGAHLSVEDGQLVVTPRPPDPEPEPQPAPEEPAE